MPSSDDPNLDLVIIKRGREIARLQGAEQAAQSLP